MKLEKISDNQIRCTLNKQDLVDRELKISELAYGTEKAKALFRDMMQQASNEFGFDADDIPLMIEAIPVSAECLILNVTKVEDPDELDTRFSKFTSDRSVDSSEPESEDEEPESFADEIINCFEHLDEIFGKSDKDKDNVKDFTPLAETLTDNQNPDKEKDTVVDINKTDLTKVYLFHTLNEVIELSSIIENAYNGYNTLYKDTSTNKYYLAIRKSEHTPEEFNKVCNIISEYSRPVKITYATIAYYEEHFDVIVRGNAVQVLKNL